MPTQTDTLETAIKTVTDGYRDAHAGADADLSTIQSAIDAAEAAGHGSAEIFRTAELRFAQWLIDNSDRH